MPFNPPEEPPDGPWCVGMSNFERQFEVSGAPNVFPKLQLYKTGQNTYRSQFFNGFVGLIDTEHQQLHAELACTTHKLNTTAKAPNDYYSIYGHMTHGIRHQDPYFGQPKHWPTGLFNPQGYYVSTMVMQMDVITPGGTVYAYGPGNSTVGQTTSSFNIGGALSAMLGFIDGGTAGMNFGFGNSFSTPDVTIAASELDRSMRWTVSLPGPGVVEGGLPQQPSYSGFQWWFGAIIETPPNAAFKMAMRPEVTFRYQCRYSPELIDTDLPEYAVEVKKLGNPIVDTQTWNPNPGSGSASIPDYIMGFEPLKLPPKPGHGAGGHG